MKLASCGAFLVFLGVLFAMPLDGHASPPPADRVHLHPSNGLEIPESDLDRPAGKRAKGESPDYVVRVFYFFPKDRTPRRDVVVQLDALLKHVQGFYADEMERHGFSRKTFSLETNENENTVVHHVEGKHNNSFYLTGNGISEASGEINEQFNRGVGLVYFIWIDLDDPEGPSQIGGNAFGTSFGGEARITATNFDSAPRVLYIRTWTIMAHELGHALGLPHDFRDDRYIMSYGDQVLQDRLSRCAAEWLDVHRFFNTRQSADEERAKIQMQQPSLASPPDSIRLRFTVTDPDGLHQARLVTDTIDGKKEQEGDKVLDCKSLNGASNEVAVEFITSELAARSKYVGLDVIDAHGNFAQARFNVDIAALRPVLEAIPIPDAELRVAIRKMLDLAANDAITKQEMLDLTSLFARNHRITSLAGLEHAANLKYVDLSINQIADITPLTELTRLKSLLIIRNRITDITPLAGLTKMSELWLSDNEIIDVTPLEGLKKTTYLLLGGNKIRDITPLAELNRLRGLFLQRNQISDITPLVELSLLEDLSLARNQINDLRPLVGLRYLNQLWIAGNPMADMSPLGELLRQNPNVAMDVKIGDVPPPELVKIAGDDQKGSVGSKLDEPFVVAVSFRSGSAYVGAVVSFSVTDGNGKLSDETVITDSSGRASSTLTLEGGPGTVTVTATLSGTDQIETFVAAALGTPDFDGDGTVGFSDFLQFAGNFGLSHGDEGYDARFDLDGNGAIGFSDFLIFAGAFGKETP